MNQVSDLVSFSRDICKIGEFLDRSILCLVDVDGSEMEVLRDFNLLCNSASSLSFVRLIVESDFSPNGVNNIPQIVAFLSSSGWNIGRILRQNPVKDFEASLSGYLLSSKWLGGWKVARAVNLGLLLRSILVDLMAKCFSKIFLFGYLLILFAA